MKEFHFGLGPFIKSKNKTTRMMIHLFIALIPIILFSFYKNGIIPFQNNKTNIIGMFYPLIFIITGSLSTFIFETLYGFLFLKKSGDKLKDFIKNSHSLFPGLFLALILPINTPIYILIFGALIASIIGKMLFGGFGNNIFNPALVGCLFIMAAYSVLIANNGGYLNNYEVDAITSATPLSHVVDGIGTYETSVKPYGSLWNFFIGTIPGAIGETSALLCIIAFIYLSITKTIKWRISMVYVLTVFAMTSIIGAINNLGIWYPLFQVLSGGLLFGAVFMATDPVTSPTTQVGQVLYGLFLGILTIVFRYLTPYPEGVLTSILTMNMLVYILDRIGAKSRFNFNNSLFCFILSWLLIVGFGLYIGQKYNVPKTTTDPNYNIVQKSVNGTKTTYVVTEKGFSSLMKAEIIIKNNKIEAINILEGNDSYFQKIIDVKYTDKIIAEQNDLENIDTVTGATVSSNAFKKMIINTVNDYNGNANGK